MSDFPQFPKTPLDPSSPEFAENLDRFLGDLELMIEVGKAQNLAAFQPYPKQKLFFRLGATKKERLLIAGNQLGKTSAGAYETALHLTGLYPPEWEGRKWERAVSGWACGVSGAAVRDTPQKLLFGTPGVESDLGTGFIPRHLIIDRDLAKGTANLFDTVYVRHVSGGTSRLVFKSYEQGREKFQSDTLDFVWCDEEPDEEIYTECGARISATDGIIYTTFTPLKGKTKLIIRFFDKQSPSRAHVTMTYYDAPHMTKERIKENMDLYPVYQHNARLMGIPILGTGRVWPFPDEMIMESAIPDVPPHWAKIWGLDFGIGDEHPFAATLCLHDRDADIFHVHHSFKLVNSIPIQHCAGIKFVAARVPVAWPHDGDNREKISGQVLVTAYKNEGILTLPTRSEFVDGSIAPNAGVEQMGFAMKEGKFKVASHLTSWFDEWREYSRDNGIIIKKRDDEMDATRCAWMAKRFAKAVALGGVTAGHRRGRGPQIADGVDFDPFRT